MISTCGVVATLGAAASSALVASCAVAGSLGAVASGGEVTSSGVVASSSAARPELIPNDNEPHNSHTMPRALRADKGPGAGLLCSIAPPFKCLDPYLGSMQLYEFRQYAV